MAQRSVEDTNRFLRRLAIGAITVLLVGALVTMVWVAIVLGGDVSLIKARQVAFHQDTTSQATALATSDAAVASLTAIVSCQAKELNAILVDLYDSQQAVLHHQTPPIVTLPRPC